MALPATAILDSIRSLSGKARITFPEGNKRVERIARFPKDNWQLAFDVADQEHTECLLTDQQKLKEDGQYVEVYRVYDKLPGTALTGIVVTPEGQVGTLTKQPVVPGTTLIPSALMVSGSVQPDGAGKSLMETVVVSDVFPQISYSAEKPDTVPAKFRVLSQSGTTECTMEGSTVSMPVLFTGDIAKSEQQTTKFLKRVRTTRRDSATLPKSLTQKSVEPNGVRISVTETLQVGDVASTNTSTDTYTSEAIGDGSYVVTKKHLEEIFPASTFSKEKADLTPAKFKAAQQEETNEHSEVGIAESPTLDTNEFSASEQQQTKFVKRVRRTFRNTSTASELTEKVMVPDGRTGTRIITLGAGAQSFTPDSTMLSADVEALGDGRTVMTVVKATEIFPGSTFAVEKADLTPTKFKAAQPEETTEHTEVGIAVNPSLGSTEFSKSEQQQTKFLKRVRTTSRNNTLNSTLTEQVMSPDGLVAVRTITLGDSTQAISTNASTLSADIETLGDGRTVKTVLVAPSIFPNTQMTVRKDVNIPSRFLGTVSRTEIASTFEASTWPSTASTLTGNEVSKTTEQVTAFKVRTVTSSLPSQYSTDVSTTETTGQYGGGIATVVETLGSTNQQAEAGYLVINSKVENIGGGSTIRTSAKLSTLPALTGQTYDEVLGNAVSYTVQTIDANTHASYPSTDIKPIDMWRSQVTSTDQASLDAALSAWSRVYTANPEIVMPDVLKSVTVHYSAGGSSGDSYALGESITASADAQVTVAADAEVVINRGFRGAVMGSTVEFFIPAGSNAFDTLAASPYSASPWPTWTPQSHAMIIHSESKSARITGRGSAANETASLSQSSEHSSSHKITVVDLPNLLHDDVTIGETMFATGDVSFQASTGNSYTYKATATAHITLRTSYFERSTSSFKPWSSTLTAASTSTSATGFHEPATLASNLPATWPTVAIHGIDIQPYKLGWQKVRAVLVDLSPYSPLPA